MIHPVFKKFEITPDTTVSGYMRDFLGVKTDSKFMAPNHIDYTLDCKEYPPFNEEYIEWIDVLTSVIMAKEKFTMIELGAGWGRWISRAHAAMKQVHPEMDAYYIGVEAEPTHYKWMCDHCSYNRMMDQALLIESAVSDADGDIKFHTGKPAEWYGQCIGGEATVRCMSLETILRDCLKYCDSIDLMDLDVQNYEFIILNSAKELLQKVKKIHIGTHSTEVEKDLRNMFRPMGWKCVNDFSLFTRHATKYGSADFNDGIQTWVSPEFYNEYNRYINTLFRFNQNNFILS